MVIALASAAVANGIICGQGQNAGLGVRVLNCAALLWASSCVSQRDPDGQVPGTVVTQSK